MAVSVSKVLGCVLLMMMTIMLTTKTTTASLVLLPQPHVRHVGDTTWWTYGSSSYNNNNYNNNNNNYNNNNYNNNNPQPRPYRPPFQKPPQPQPQTYPYQNQRYGELPRPRSIRGFDEPVCSHICDNYPQAMCFRYCAVGTPDNCMREDYQFYFYENGRWNYLQKALCHNQMMP